MVHRFTPPHHRRPAVAAGLLTPPPQNTRPARPQAPTCERRADLSLNMCPSRFLAMRVTAVPRRSVFSVQLTLRCSKIHTRFTLDSHKIHQTFNGDSQEIHRRFTGDSRGIHSNFTSVHTEFTAIQPHFIVDECVKHSGQAGGFPPRVLYASLTSL